MQNMQFITILTKANNMQIDKNDKDNIKFERIVNLVCLAGLIAIGLSIYFGVV